MHAIHGGTAQHDTIDAQNIAALLRGGLLPQASGSPAAMRAARARLRRRTHVRRTRAELLTPIPQTHRQYHRPELGTKIASTAHRDGGAERFAEPAVPQRLAGDRALLGHDDQRRRDVERSLRTTARPPNAQTLSRRRTVPGLGASLSGVLRYDIHDSTRVPRGQDCLSSCRLVQCTQEAAGQR
jgi:hypothetical protein